MTKLLTMPEATRPALNDNITALEQWRRHDVARKARQLAHNLDRQRFWGAWQSVGDKNAQ